jgi:ribonuclease HIII
MGKDELRNQKRNSDGFLQKIAHSFQVFILQRSSFNLHPFCMLSLHSQTFPLTTAQAEKLRVVLDAAGFIFEEKPYTLYAARKEKLSISVYEKGPKAVLQGRGLEDFITFVLEPEILGEARLGYEEVHAPEQFEPHFGIDESGKGDFFGPLVIAGVYVDGGLARHLRDAGVRDSKGIGSDRKIRDLATLIRKSGAPFEVIVIGPEKYNQLYRSIGNLNRLLAWGHSRVIENLCVRVPGCRRALSDKFADARVLQKALLEHGRKIQLDQRTKAESDYAVAAASILAREGFINWLDKAGGEFGVVLAKGVSPKVKAAASELIARHGADVLSRVAKLHFKTASEVLGGTDSTS